MTGSIRNSPITKILVDPVKNSVGLNVFSGTPVSPTQIAVAVTDWSAGTVVMTQDGADGLVGGSSAPSYGLQLGFLSSGVFVAVSGTNPLPVVTGGGAVTYLQAPVSFNASGDNTIVAAVTGKVINIQRLFLVNGDGSTTTQITFKDSTPTSFSGAFPLIPAGSFTGDSEGGAPLFTTGTDKGFIVNSSAAVQISGTVWYTEQ
jgi:hypothetical protein